MRIKRKPTPTDPFLGLLPNPVVEVDPSYTVTYLNPAARLALPDLERSGKEHPLLAGLSNMLELLSKEGSQMAVFVREVTQAGSTYEQQIFTVPEKKRLYLFMADVTQRKQALEELRESEQKLQASNLRLGELLVAKDKFVANVSHELRTPLTAIKEGVSLLKDGVLGSVSEEQSGFLQTVAKNADRLALLIEHILDISRIGAGCLWLSRRRLKLPSLVETNLGQLKSVAGRRTIRCEVGATPDVFADDSRISQVVANLFSNAIKFTKEDGAITCSFQVREGSVAVTVRDDGVGMAPEDLSKLFERFSQVGEYKTGGTGLGLVLCKELVELHRGTISVSSGLGKGSAFTFTLPVYTPEFALEESLRQILETGKSSLSSPMVGLIAIDCGESAGAPGAASASGSQSPIERLEQIAERVRHDVKNEDLVLAIEPRWVVCLAPADVRGVQAICRRLQGSLGHSCVNLGWVFYPVDGEDAKTLFAEATNFIRQRRVLSAVIASPAAEAASEAKQEAISPGPRKRRILVADDDPAILQVMALRLQTLGFEVKVAFDGEEVLEQVKGKEPIDLILLDLKLPRMDGFEVCRQLKTIKKEIPVLAFTAYGQELKDKCNELGLTDLLPKPFSTETLIERVTQAMERKKSTP